MYSIILTTFAGSSFKFLKRNRQRPANRQALHHLPPNENQAPLPARRPTPEQPLHGSTAATMPASWCPTIQAMSSTAETSEIALIIINPIRPRLNRPKNTKIVLDKDPRRSDTQAVPKSFVEGVHHSTETMVQPSCKSRTIRTAALREAAASSKRCSIPAIIAKTINMAILPLLNVLTARALNHVPFHSQRQAKGNCLRLVRSQTTKPCQGLRAPSARASCGLSDRLCSLYLHSPVKQSHNDREPCGCGLTYAISSVGLVGWGLSKRLRPLDPESSLSFPALLAGGNRRRILAASCNSREAAMY